jgi:hypothetical protein
MVDSKQACSDDVTSSTPNLSFSPSIKHRTPHTHRRLITTEGTRCNIIEKIQQQEGHVIFPLFLLFIVMRKIITRMRRRRVSSGAAVVLLIMNFATSAKLRFGLAFLPARITQPVSRTKPISYGSLIDKESSNASAAEEPKFLLYDPNESGKLKDGSLSDRIESGVEYSPAQSQSQPQPQPQPGSLTDRIQLGVQYNISSKEPGQQHGEDQHAHRAATKMPSIVQNIVDKVGKIDDTRIISTPEYLNGEVPKLFSNLHYATITQSSTDGTSTTKMIVRPKETNWVASSSVDC